MVAKTAGIDRIEIRSGLPAGAALQRDDRGHFIAVAATSRERQNFSILHEVGHHLIGKSASALGPLTPQQVKAVKAGYQEEEDLCDRLAAELLLPAAEFRDRISEAGTPPTWQGLRRLAGLFGASVEATVRRFGQFYEETILVERWSHDRKEGRLGRSVLAVSEDLRPFAIREGRFPTRAPDFVVDLLAREATHLHRTVERQLPVRGSVRTLRVQLWKRRAMEIADVLLLATPA